MRIYTDDKELLRDKIRESAARISAHDIATVKQVKKPESGMQKMGRIAAHLRNYASMVKNHAIEYLRQFADYNTARSLTKNTPAMER